MNSSREDSHPLSQTISNLHDVLADSAEQIGLNMAAVVELDRVPIDLCD
jgi:hypothetical protein